MSLALARKYRPSSFDDLVGQDAVSQTLTQALNTHRLSHAYLFSGLRGSGKTSTARIFAKALLCERGESSHPCEECANCSMANEGRHMDIIEMDAASNRGIDDIKDLIEHTKYKPSIARYKIFIIDEVHMLTPQAFNALLKTLEEPPPFVKFILATTDPLKLPATILSRTQHFRFKKIAQKLILQHLEHILNKERVSYEREALDIIARSGAGSLRDALTLLDQAIVYSKNHVDTQTVTGMLGIIEPNLLENLIDNIMVKDIEEILSFVKLSSNYETEMIIDELILFLKEILLSQNSKVPIMIIERFFRILAESKSLLSIGSDGEFVLSLTLFKMMESLEIKDIDSMIKVLEDELRGITPTPTLTTSSSIPKVIKEEIVEVTPSSSTTLFETLIKKIYDRDYDLGVCFEENISFKSYQDSTLTWLSKAEGSDKKQLITYWSIIKHFVQDSFGIETKIVNIPNIEKKEVIEKMEIPTPPPNIVEQEAPKDYTSILDEPMIKEIISTFDPKKVRIQKNQKS
jgi:DNA polymerase-3 subunit gamma/tau